MPAAHFLLDVFVRSHVVDRRPMLNVNMWNMVICRHRSAHKKAPLNGDGGDFCWRSERDINQSDALDPVAFVLSCVAELDCADQQ